MIILFVSTTVKISICARRESFRCHEDVSAIVGNPVELYHLSRNHTELYARPSQQNEKWSLPKDRHDRFLQYRSTPLHVECAPVFFTVRSVRIDTYVFSVLIHVWHHSFRIERKFETVSQFRLVRQFRKQTNKVSNDNDILSSPPSMTRRCEVSHAIDVYCL